eukprot:gene13806-19721_t
MSKMILWTLAASLLVLLADAQVASQVKVTSPVLVSDTTTAEPIVDTDMTDKNDTQVDVPQAGVLPAVGVDVGPETGVAVKVAKNATEECCWMVTDYWPRKQYLVPECILDLDLDHRLILDLDLVPECILDLDLDHHCILDLDLDHRLILDLDLVPERIPLT